MGTLGSTLSFAGLIFVLSLLRTKLVYELSGASLLLFGTTKPGIYFYSLLVLPGTIIHELSHWLVAEILQVRTGEIVILPELSGSGREERLGSVATAKSDPFRGFLIGIAPFITGLAILFILGQLLFSAWQKGVIWWQLALIIYGIMVVGNSMMISRADRRTWPFILILLVFVIFFFRRLELSPSPSVLTGISQSLTSLNLVLLMTAIFNLVMIWGSYIIRKLIEKLTKRRIQ